MCINNNWKMSSKLHRINLVARGSLRHGRSLLKLLTLFYGNRPATSIFMCPSLQALRKDLRNSVDVWQRFWPLFKPFWKKVHKQPYILSSESFHHFVSARNLWHPGHKLWAATQFLAADRVLSILLDKVKYNLIDMCSHAIHNRRFVK